jgi:hypothetical protein
MNTILRALVVALAVALPLALAACDKGGGTTDTGTDITPDTGEDTAVDTPPPDTTPPDTTDTGTDTGTDPGCVGATGGICHAVEQCGCSPGYYCEILFDSATCTLIEDCQAGGGGTTPIEGECETAGTCPPGTACLTRSGETVGHCYQWCRDSSDCDIAGRECTVSVNFTLPAPCTGTAEAPYQACEIGCPDDTACNLFAADETEETVCPSGEMCVRDAGLADGGCDISFCTDAGTLAEGADCSDTSGDSCGYGMGCYGSTTGGFFCRYFCDATHTCASGTCSTIRSEALPELGICVP